MPEELKIEQKISQNNIVEFSCHSHNIFQLQDDDGKISGLLLNNKPVMLKTENISRDNSDLTYTENTWEITDYIRQINPGLYSVERTWHNKSEYSQDVCLCFQLYRKNSINFYIIPSVNYNGNSFGNSKEPKGLYDSYHFQAKNGKFEKEACWIFGGDRGSVPSCTITEDSHFTVGLFTEANDNSFSSCSIEEMESKGAIQKLFWPYQDAPYSYQPREIYNPPISELISIGPDKKVKKKFFISLHQQTEPNQGYVKILDDAWKLFYHKLHVKFKPNHLWRLGIKFIKTQLWNETQDYLGTIFGITFRDNKWIVSPWKKLEIGWVGQYGLLACMLLYDSIKNCDKDSWQKGEAMLDFWQKNGILSNGLIYVNYDMKLSGNTEQGLDTCNLGWGAYQYYLGFELAKEKGLEKSEWLNTANGICDFFVKNILPDNKFGKYWTIDGKVLDTKGTVGAFITWALIKGYRITQNSQYLQAAEASFRAYADDDLRRVCCAAGALDADCVDKETAFPLLMSGLDLYEITGKNYYLDQAEKAAYYLASWQITFSVKYLEDSPAAEIQYDTFGGTKISVKAVNTDPWGQIITIGWFRLASLTNNPVWLERAKAVWDQGNLSISDGNLKVKNVTKLEGSLPDYINSNKPFEKTIYPEGSQPESVNGTRRIKQGGLEGKVSNWCPAWCTAFRLFVLQQITDWNFFE